MTRGIVVFTLVFVSLTACAILAATNPAADTQRTTQPTAAKFPGPAEMINKLKAAKDAIASPALPQVAYFDLSHAISEKPADFSFFAADQSTTLHSLLDRLEQARQDKDIRAVLITLGGASPNLSQSLELRDELRELKKSGKRTFVYADAYDAHGYVLASGATDVCILGGGEIEMPGVGLEVLFAKGLLDKIGVEANYEQIGKYKGADEEYINTQPSPEMAGELNKLVDGLYAQLIDNISQNRHLDSGAVKKIVDQALIPAVEARRLGLVDHLVDADGLRDLMADQLGGKVDLIRDYGQAARQAIDFSSPFAFLSLFAHQAATSDRQAVALIYAQGVIVDGATGQSLFTTSTEVGSEDIRQALRLAERDEHIEAVVIRIDSPGGSALASEVMWQAVRRVAKTKPVVVSIGSMAASGGYYLASSANTVYADPTAIVGSIGVVGGKFVLKDLYAKLGLSTATFQRGANADLFTSDAPWTPRQRTMVHNWMKQTYDQFTQRVMTTRKGKIKDIDQVAQGRIFLAAQAKELGMIDEIGGLSDAIASAAKQADLPAGDYDVRVIPAPRTLADLFNGGPDARLPMQPDMLAADSLLNLLPTDQRSALEEQITLLKLFESRPMALVCPYVIRSR